VELEPYSPLAHWVLGRAYLFSGYHQEGVQTLEGAAELPDHASMWVAELCYARGAAGDRTGAERLAAMLYQRHRDEYVSPFS
jgi:hypothetical protein